jgi:hypothetical protein
MTPARAKDFRHIPDPCNANAGGIPVFSFSNQALLASAPTHSLTNQSLNLNNSTLHVRNASFFL